MQMGISTEDKGYAEVFSADVAMGILPQSHCWALPEMEYSEQAFYDLRFIQDGWSSFFEPVLLYYIIL